MTLVLTILGCGSSGGVPRLGQGWGACDPAEPRNRRLRCSVLLERTGPDGGKTVVLVDTSPDLREQLLRAEVDRLDALVLTHPHADHTHGIDDVRPMVLQMHRRIPIHMDAATSAIVRRSFAYIFETPPGSLYPPLLDEVRMAAGQPVSIDGPGGPIEFIPFRLEHGEIDALGLRLGKTAYTPDVNAIPSDSVRFLEGLDLWIIDALRYSRHPSHFSLEEALDWVERMKPARAVLTNLHTDLDYAVLNAKVPAHITAAYDGMRLTIG
jgi:phosphoribosyl 1,2-cyclic phosphate phosphodiesterase